MTQPNEQNQEHHQSNLSRRVFLGAGVSAAAAFAFPKFAKAQGAKPTATCPTNTCTPIKTLFPQPCIVTSQNREAKLTMGVVEKTITIPGLDPPSNQITARTYDGLIPGRSIYVNPGDRISIDLTNCLNPDDPSAKNKPNQPKNFNTTNLHFHGLHVSPKSTTSDPPIASDDVFLDIEPNGKHSWCVEIPEFHAPGTHWYHAHFHGATGLQVAKGMAGAIIIKEPEANKIVDEANDIVWLIQELIAGDDCSVYSETPGRDPGHFIVNGRYQPVLTVSKNQLQRWRFINATGTPRGFMNLQLCSANPTLGTLDKALIPCNNPPNIYLMAVDGISFYGNKPRPISGSTGWLFGPGNRADFLVSLQPGIYKLIKGEDRDAPASVRSTQILAYIHVTDTKPIQPSPFNPATDKIPGTFPSYLQPIQAAEICKKPSPTTVVFSIPKQRTSGCPPSPGQGFKINDQVYDPDVVNYTVKLNTAEEWKLSNTSGSPHPFHIHVNPFQLIDTKAQGQANIGLIDPNGDDVPANRIWWDSIPVIKGKDLTIWHRFLDYYGDFVLHCHILVHEDQGMMQNVTIVDDPSNPGTGPCVPLKKGTSPNLNPTCLSSSSSPDVAQPSPQPTSSATPSPQAGSGGGKGTGGGGGKLQ